MTIQQTTNLVYVNTNLVLQIESCVGIEQSLDNRKMIALGSYHQRRPALLHDDDEDLCTRHPIKVSSN